jgi:hypothetical protein
MGGGNGARVGTTTIFGHGAIDFIEVLDGI